ncbi:MAG: hypothetical protein QXN59_03240, partial [Candidatus Micrarchaeaceae archaeon]
PELVIVLHNMEKSKQLEEFALSMLSNSSCSISTKVWLVQNSIDSEAGLEKAARMNLMPSVSIAAFRKISDEHKKASILVSMFASNGPENLIAIGHSVVSSISSPKLLWDICQAKGIPKELKPYVESRIESLSRPTPTCINIIIRKDW